MGKILVLVKFSKNMAENDQKSRSESFRVEKRVGAYLSSSPEYIRRGNDSSANWKRSQIMICAELMILTHVIPFFFLSVIIQSRSGMSVARGTTQVLQFPVTSVPSIDQGRNRSSRGKCATRNRVSHATHSSFELFRPYLQYERENNDNCSSSKNTEDIPEREASGPRATSAIVQFYRPPLPPWRAAIGKGGEGGRGREKGEGPSFNHGGAGGEEGGRTTVHG